VKDADTIIISDYGKGVISPKVSQLVISTANQMGKATIVDPKGSDWSKYQNATIVTPNVKELAEVANRRVNNSDYEIISAGQEVRARYGLKYLVVTRSEKGVTILSEEGVTHIATKAKEVYDVSGAGDTVVATMACALAVGASIQNAVDIANAAAGVVVSKVGTVPITMDDLLHYLHAKREDSAIPLDRLVMLIDGYKKRGKRIVFTNGCFDILHRGHVDYLRKAKSLGDILVLGLNSDSSVKRLKGESRPINNEEDRAFVLAALDSVDYVVIFDEDTPKELLSHIKPDLLVKGGDYTPETVIGKEYAKEVAIIDFVDGYSTTRTIERMR
jgi:D-beta-D-heptose 7-phosphate kinase/D-beta-D-heptose 1-phosphate adenosyltransferase